MALKSQRKERIDALAEASADAGVSLAASAWRRLKRNPVFVVGAVIIAVFVLVALLAPLLAPHDPALRVLVDQVSRAENTIPPPQEGFPLGGDQYGRDLFSRLLLGSQQTLLVAVLATVIGLGGGLVLGVVAGAFGGWVDSLVMRVVDVMLSVPSLLLAVSIGALFAQQSQFTVILAVAIVQVPIFGRLLRGTMLAQRASDHVLAARALGVKESSIVFRHMLPNALGPVIVQATLVLAVAIIDAAALSFLGLGAADDSVPEWGQMLGGAQNIIDSHPQLAFWPASCIILVALGFTLVGESLRDALDPKRRR
ncbi:ABC transporter permease [Saccharopolyspora indica]|uniref:Peptide/nickel transport system permease protein n=2 Tax=Saccharopolyspora TaxID=1835 RepID=A0A1I5IQS0_9PSEU|nr:MULTISPECIES: ABC transporter permease [Saccharopolyspora]MDA3645910.1 ABC transporter permease [Saccharopolyspora indica]RKT84122.1 peptide/nickel transport system permease protein [Saccharopolyspora antimicrobica]SEG83430.1 peptide/nickel transport system permease protein [Saccharopolyspora kobensis]SFE31071.1 peptide/nickel transport system permease protein [Saccharopolyspora kobensis]SFO62915.1 peptide/nickel transport system permease protein [Saccharopolyspora antimicrobica]